MNNFIEAVDQIQAVLGICPCCGEIFRLAEAKFIFPQAAPKESHYSELLALERAIDAEDERLRTIQEAFDELIAEQKEALREAGRQSARKKLLEIDPHFSGKNVNPQNVKVLFHPVEYVIFHGLKSPEGPQSIEFLSRNPQSKLQETLTGSIDRVIQSGNVEFETLRLTDDGGFEIEENSYVSL